MLLGKTPIQARSQ